ncbi:unnamed protein product [Amoebophrya sp. A120]|nr:unnamed protein product [Amoebophrya sp. A120]|eukprot:GSA120T00004149001.1
MTNTNETPPPGETVPPATTKPRTLVAKVKTEKQMREAQVRAKLREQQERRKCHRQLRRLLQKARTWMRFFPKFPPSIARGKELLEGFKSVFPFKRKLFLKGTVGLLAAAQLMSLTPLQLTQARERKFLGFNGIGPRQPDAMDRLGAALVWWNGAGDEDEEDFEEEEEGENTPFKVAIGDASFGSREGLGLATKDVAQSKDASASMTFLEAEKRGSSATSDRSPNLDGAIVATKLSKLDEGAEAITNSLLRNIDSSIPGSLSRGENVMADAGSRTSSSDQKYANAAHDFLERAAARSSAEYVSDYRRSFSRDVFFHSIETSIENLAQLNLAAGGAPKTLLQLTWLFCHHLKQEGQMPADECDQIQRMDAGAASKKLLGWLGNKISADASKGQSSGAPYRVVGRCDVPAPEHGSEAASESEIGALQGCVQSFAEGVLIHFLSSHIGCVATLHHVAVKEERDDQGAVTGMEFRLFMDKVTEAVDKKTKKTKYTFAGHAQQTMTNLRNTSPQRELVLVSKLSWCARSLMEAGVVYNKWAPENIGFLGSDTSGTVDLTRPRLFDFTGASIVDFYDFPPKYTSSTRVLMADGQLQPKQVFFFSVVLGQRVATRVRTKAAAYPHALQTPQTLPAETRYTSPALLRCHGNVPGASGNKYETGRPSGREPYPEHAETLYGPKSDWYGMVATLLELLFGNKAEINVKLQRLFDSGKSNDIYSLEMCGNVGKPEEWTAEALGKSIATAFADANMSERISGIMAKILASGFAPQLVSISDLDELRTLGEKAGANPGKEHQPASPSAAAQTEFLNLMGEAITRVATSSPAFGGAPETLLQLTRSFCEHELKGKPENLRECNNIGVANVAEKLYELLKTKIWDIGAPIYQSTPAFTPRTARLCRAPESGETEKGQLEYVRCLASAAEVALVHFLSSPIDCVANLHHVGVSYENHSRKILIQVFVENENLFEASRYPSATEAVKTGSNLMNALALCAKSLMSAGVVFNEWAPHNIGFTSATKTTDAETTPAAAEVKVDWTAPRLFDFSRASIVDKHDVDGSAGYLLERTSGTAQDQNLKFPFYSVILGQRVATRVSSDDLAEPFALQTYTAFSEISLYMSPALLRCHGQQGAGTESKSVIFEHPDAETLYSSKSDWYGLVVTLLRLLLGDRANAILLGVKERFEAQKSVNFYFPDGCSVFGFAQLKQYTMVDIRENIQTALTEAKITLQEKVLDVMIEIIASGFSPQLVPDSHLEVLYGGGSSSQKRQQAAPPAAAVQAELRVPKGPAEILSPSVRVEEANDPNKGFGDALVVMNKGLRTVSKSNSGAASLEVSPNTFLVRDGQTAVSRWLLERVFAGENKNGKALGLLSTEDSKQEFSVNLRDFREAPLRGVTYFREASLTLTSFSKPTEETGKIERWYSRTDFTRPLKGMQNRQRVRIRTCKHNTEHYQKCMENISQTALLHLRLSDFPNKFGGCVAKLYMVVVFDSQESTEFAFFLEDFVPMTPENWPKKQDEVQSILQGLTGCAAMLHSYGISYNEVSRATVGFARKSSAGVNAGPDWKRPLFHDFGMASLVEDQGSKILGIEAAHLVASKRDEQDGLRDVEAYTHPFLLDGLPGAAEGLGGGLPASCLQALDVHGIVRVFVVAARVPQILGIMDSPFTEWSRARQTAKAPEAEPQQQQLQIKTTLAHALQVQEESSEFLSIIQKIIEPSQSGIGPQSCDVLEAHMSDLVQSIADDNSQPGADEKAAIINQVDLEMKGKAEEYADRIEAIRLLKPEDTELVKHLEALSGKIFPDRDYPRDRCSADLKSAGIKITKNNRQKRFEAAYRALRVFGIDPKQGCAETSGDFQLRPPEHNKLGHLYRRRAVKVHPDSGLREFTAFCNKKYGNNDSKPLLDAAGQIFIEMVKELGEKSELLNADSSSGGGGLPAEIGAPYLPIGN